MFFWMIRGHAAEGLRWYEQILSLPSLPPAAESRALVGAATMWYAQGRARARARASVTRALALARDAGDTAIVVQAENMFGHVELAAGNLDAARDRFTRAVEGFQALAIPWGHGQCAERVGVGGPRDRRCRPGGAPARRGHVGASQARARGS